MNGIPERKIPNSVLCVKEWTGRRKMPKRVILEEFISKNGNTYRLIKMGNGNLRITKNGSVWAVHYLRYIADDKFEALRRKYS